MTVVLCAKCRGEQRTGEHDVAILCRPCTADTERRFRGALSLILTLRETQARQARVDVDTTTSGGVPDDGRRTLDHRYPQTAATTPSPIVLGPGDRIRDLRRTVEQWADRLAADVVPRLCAHETCHRVRRPLCPDADHRARVLAGLEHDAGAWVADRIGLLRHRTWAGQCALEVEHVTNAAWRTVDRPADAWFAGPCSADLDDPDVPGTVVRCGADLYARIADSTVRCRACGTEHDVAERRDQLLEAAGDMLLTAAEASRALTSLRHPLTPERIRQWAHRGRILSVDTVVIDGRPRPRYRLRDIRAALNQDTYGTVRTA